MEKILITGGAGFIGSHLAHRLKSNGHDIVIYDNLSQQIHGTDPKRTSSTYQKVSDLGEFYFADVRDRNSLRKALNDITQVVHLAAETGTGQSMYAIENYCDVNIRGTAILLEEIISLQSQIKKIVVASSRAVYGEGKYNCSSHGTQFPLSRKDQAMREEKFEHTCSICNQVLSIQPTSEDSLLHPQSIYGVTKLSQEQLVLGAAKSAQINATALRFQNVYGPGQSLSNPYTGILSIFSTRARDNKPISIFEDGQESRDFVFISDVVESIILSLDLKKVGQTVFNIGSGRLTTVAEVVNQITSYFKSTAVITITKEYRVGDIRHNFADLNLANNDLKYEPTIFFDEGIRYFLDWVQSQQVPTDLYEKSLSELRDRGLLKR